MLNNTIERQNTAGDVAKMKPMGELMTVRRDSKETTTEAGIYVPEKQIESRTTGTVIGVSDQLKDLYEPGCRVLFSRMGGEDIDDDHLVLHQDDVLCIIED